MNRRLEHTYDLQALLNEKFCPELLEHKMDIVECMMEQLEQMEENISRARTGDFKVSIHRMEVSLGGQDGGLQSQHSPHGGQSGGSGRGTSKSAFTAWRSVWGVRTGDFKVSIHRMEVSLGGQDGGLQSQHSPHGGQSGGSGRETS